MEELSRFAVLKDESMSAETSKEDNENDRSWSAVAKKSDKKSPAPSHNKGKRPANGGPKDKASFKKRKGFDSNFNISSEEKQKRFKEGRCLKCNAKGHLAKDCKADAV